MKTLTIARNELAGTKTKYLIDYLVQNNLATIPNGQTRMNTKICEMLFNDGYKCVEGEADFSTMYLYLSK